MNESFRHLNVSLDSIQNMTDERNAANIELKSTKSQLSLIIKYFESANQFEPSIEFYKDEFGILKLESLFSKNIDSELDDEEEDEDENEYGDEDEDEEEEVEEYEYED